jgi:hypothetical protein
MRHLEPTDKSLHRESANHTLINSAWYAETSVSPLVHSLGTPKNQDAPLMLKHLCHGLPGQAGQRGHFSNGECGFLQH